VTSFLRHNKIKYYVINAYCCVKTNYFILNEILITNLAIDSAESLQHDHNYDQQAKDITLLFRNRLQCLSFLVGIYSWDYMHEHERRK